MAKKRVKKGYRHIRGMKLKAPTYSPVFWEADRVKREQPSRPGPEAGYREYDLNRLDKGGTKTGGIWELSLFPLEGLCIIADELRKRARLENPGLEVELRDSRVLLETDLITEEEYQRREREIRAKYEEKDPAPSKTKSGRRRAIKR